LKSRVESRESRVERQEARGKRQEARGKRREARGERREARGEKGAEVARAKELSVLVLGSGRWARLFEELAATGIHFALTTEKTEPL
jgi:hypothetical protein